MEMITTFNLTKQYKGQGGCREINLSVPSGHIFGLLGPNGAGKSTLVKTLVGLLQPTSGSALILGNPLGSYKCREKIGFLPELFSYQKWLSAEELLTLHGQLYKMTKQAIKKRIPEVLTLTGLTGTEHKKVGSFSKGMQQRIGLACALMNEPKLLFLDEPTSALDPLGRRDMREIMLNLKETGTTIFLNSHLLSEVEAVCDQVAIINKGRLVAVGEMEELLAKKCEVEIELDTISPEFQREIKEWGKILAIQNNTLQIQVADKETVPLLAKKIIEAGYKLYNLHYRHSSLEDVFVQLVEGGEQQDVDHS